MFSNSDEFTYDWLDEKIFKCAYNNEKIRNKMFGRYAWNSINYIVSFAEQNEEKYELIYQCISDIDIGIYEEIISEMLNDNIIFGYFLYVIEKKGNELERHRILWKYVTRKNDCLDCFINTAQNDGRIDILEDIYYTLWKGIYVKSNVSINELIDELYDQEKKLEVLGKKCQRSIMWDFRKLFQEKGAFEIETIKNVFSGDNADTTSLSFKTVCFMNHCIKNYGWDSKFIQNRRPMPDDIYDSLKTRSMIDDIILDQNFYMSSKRDEILRYLFCEHRKSTIQKFHGYIEAKIDEKTKNENAQSKTQAEENIALLGLLKITSMRNSQKSNNLAWTYLGLLDAGTNTISEKTMSWRGYGYLMFGLKWLCIMGHSEDVIINNTDAYKMSFVRMFANNIDSQRKKYILECRETYEKYVKNGIDVNSRKELAAHAKESNDDELIAMFPMEKGAIASKTRFHLQSIFGQKNPAYIPPEEPSQPRHSQKERSDDN